MPFTGELRALIESAIEALPEHYRAVFVMREVEGMSTAESAGRPCSLHQLAANRSRVQLRGRAHNARRSRPHRTTLSTATVASAITANASAPIGPRSIPVNSRISSWM